MPSSEVSRETLGRETTEVLELSTIRMIRWKCRGIPIRVATILLALQRSGYDVDEDVAALLEVLADQETEVSSAVRVAVGVLRELWLSSVLLHKLLAVTDALLEVLVRDRGPAVLEHVKAGVATAMRLAPQHERPLLQQSRGSSSADTAARLSAEVGCVGQAFS